MKLADRLPRWPGWATPLLAAAAVLAGLSLDRIGESGRINILAPPLLGLIAWNLLVYAALAVRPPPRGPLPVVRLAQALHLAAALLAAAMLASMYARGLAVEYRAGWDSTFLDAAAVHRIVSVVLGPAAALAGIALPGAAELDALRFSRGGGENAARWIHLHALTVLATVVLPRLLLAARAAALARRLAREAAEQSGQPAAPARRIAVVPYGFAAAASRGAALRRELGRAFGGPVEPVLMAGVPVGGEDTLAASHATPPSDVDDDLPVLLLFPLTATPEPESHGAFVRAARAQWGRRLVAWIDESDFRQRLDAPAAAARLEPRRAAWREVLGAETTAFVDLAPSEAKALADG